MQRILTIILPLLAIVILGVGGSVLVKSMAPKPEKSQKKSVALSVFVAPAQSRDFQLTAQAQGTVRPVRQINLAPQISGRIAYVSPAFEDGGAIEKGQTLIQLEQDDYQLALIRARASVASAEQILIREQAEGALARQDLEDLGYSSASDLALRKPQMDEAKAALDSAKAQLAEAQLALSRTVITAPFTGLVSQKAVDIGQFVSPGQTLGQIFDISAFQIYLPIQDSEFAKTGLNFAFVESAEETGPRVDISGVVGGTSHQWLGRVVRTSATINEVSRQIGVIVQVDDPFGAGADNGVPLLPGLFVEAQIFGELVQNVVIIPRAGLRSFKNVYVANREKGVLDIRIADVAHSDPEQAILRAGVSAGELVVTSLIDGPTQGMRLRMLESLENGTIRQIEATNPDPAPDMTGDNDDRDDA